MTVSLKVDDCGKPIGWCAAGPGKEQEGAGTLQAEAKGGRCASLRKALKPMQKATAGQVFP